MASPPLPPNKQTSKQGKAPTNHSRGHVNPHDKLAMIGSSILDLSSQRKKFDSVIFNVPKFEVQVDFDAPLTARQLANHVSSVAQVLSTLPFILKDTGSIWLTTEDARRSTYSASDSKSLDKDVMQKNAYRFMADMLGYLELPSEIKARVITSENGIEDSFFTVVHNMRFGQAMTIPSDTIKQANIYALVSGSNPDELQFDGWMQGEEVTQQNKQGNYYLVPQDKLHSLNDLHGYYNIGYGDGGGSHPVPINDWIHLPYRVMTYAQSYARLHLQAEFFLLRESTIQTNIGDQNHQQIFFMSVNQNGYYVDTSSIKIENSWLGSTLNDAAPLLCQMSVSNGGECLIINIDETTFHEALSRETGLKDIRYTFLA